MKPLRRATTMVSTLPAVAPPPPCRRFSGDAATATDGHVATAVKPHATSVADHVLCLSCTAQEWHYCGDTAVRVIATDMTPQPR